MRKHQNREETRGADSPDETTEADPPAEGGGTHGRQAAFGVAMTAGLLADATAIATWALGVGRAFIWPLATFCMLIGIVVLARRWGRPIDFVVIPAAVATLAGSGTLGYAIGRNASSRREESRYATPTSTHSGIPTSTSPTAHSTA